MSRRLVCTLMTFVSDRRLQARSSTEAIRSRVHPLLAIVEVGDVRLLCDVTDDERSQLDARK